MLRVCAFPQYRYSEDLDFDWLGSPTVFHKTFRRRPGNSSTNQRRRTHPPPRERPQPHGPVARQRAPRRYEDRSRVPDHPPTTHPHLDNPTQPPWHTPQPTDTRLPTGIRNGRQAHPHLPSDRTPRLLRPQQPPGGQCWYTRR